MSYSNVPRTEVSIWADSLSSGALPRICVKSGKPADTVVRVQYRSTDRAALAGLIPGLTSRRPGELQVIRGELPVTSGWSAIITMARFAMLIALVGAGYGVWQAMFVRSHSATALVILTASAVFLQLYYSFRARLEPSGQVFNTPSGAAWVRLHGVHPNFVAAVEGPEALAGTASASFVLKPPDTPPPAWQKPPVWLAWVGMTALWILIGIGAWIRFHG